MHFISQTDPEKAMESNEQLVSLAPRGTSGERGHPRKSASSPRPSPPLREYVFSALRTRHLRTESAGLALAAAFGVRQLVGAFARGMGGSAANWLALAEDSGDKSPHSQRWRDCKTAACVPTPGLCDALNRYKGEGWGEGKRCEVSSTSRTDPGFVELDKSSSRAGDFPK